MIKLLLKFKNIILLVVAALAITIAVVVSRHSAYWKFNWFDRKLKIDSTENVVQEVRKISELTTACFYQEMVITRQKIDPNMLNFILQTLHLTNEYDKDELALIVKGEIRAGFVLDSLKKENVHIVSDTLFITLPQPQILDVIVNPSDFEVFSEDGKWSHQNIVQIQKQAEELLKKKAIREGIMKKARQSGIDKLSKIFKVGKFSEVEFSFEEHPN